MTAIPTIDTERPTARPPSLADFNSRGAVSASDRAAFIGGPTPPERLGARGARDDAHSRRGPMRAFRHPGPDALSEAAA